jgi:hypothetical protein
VFAAAPLPDDLEDHPGNHVEDEDEHLVATDQGVDHRQIRVFRDGEPLAVGLVDQTPAIFTINEVKRRRAMLRMELQRKKLVSIS